MANTVYTPFTTDDKVVATPSRITRGLWSDGEGELLTFFTASVDPPGVGTLSRYYYDVYGSAVTSSAQVEFSIAYGQMSGSGSPSIDYDYPSKAIFGQYKNLLLYPGSQFTYTSAGTVVSMSQFFAISIKRANLKQKLDVGNWELHLDNLLDTSSGDLTLIDDSGDSLDTSGTSTGRVYTIVSGTINGGQSGINAYGLVYPDYGIILINPAAISQSLKMPINLGSTAYTSSNGKSNITNFFTSIDSGSYFVARSEENISSTHYFVRIKNQQYNYSTNPTFYSASDGTIIQPNFYIDPVVFITTIGLYSTTNELLAVAKLSQPVAKGFDKEALIKCRLDF